MLARRAQWQLPPGASVIPSWLGLQPSCWERESSCLIEDYLRCPVLSTYAIRHAPLTLTAPPQPTNTAHSPSATKHAAEMPFLNQTIPPPACRLYKLMKLFQPDRHSPTRKTILIEQSTLPTYLPTLLLSQLFFNRNLPKSPK